MPLAKQVATIPLATGIVAGVDPKVSPGITRAENVTYDVEGAARPVRAQETVGSAVAGVHSMISQNGVALKYADIAADGTSYIQAPIGANNDSWTTLKGVPALATFEKFSQSLNYSTLYRNVEVAVGANFYVIAYTTYDPSASTLYTVELEVFDRDTGVLKDSAQLYAGSTAEMARVVCSDGEFKVFYANGTTMYHMSVSGTTGLIGSGTSTGVARYAGVTAFDAINVRNANASYDYAVVAYAQSATIVRVISYASGGSESYSWTQGGFTGLNKIWLAEGTGTILLAVNDVTAGNFTCESINYDATSNGTKVTMSSDNADSVAAHQVGADSVDLWYNNTASVSGVTCDNLYRRTWTVSTGSISTKDPILPHARISSKCTAVDLSAPEAAGYFLGIESRMPGEHSATKYLQTNHYVIRGDQYTAGYDAGPPVAAKVQSGLQYPAHSFVRNVGRDTSGGATEIWDVVPVIAQLSTDLDMAAQHSLVRTKLTPGVSNVPYCEDQAGIAHIAGSCPLEVDATRVYESGFHQYPTILTSTAATSGGSMAASTYRYKAVFEWMDSQGRIHRSAPTVEPEAVTTTAAGVNKVTVVVSTLGITRRPNVVVALYRTLGNGTIYYRCATIVQPNPSSQAAGSAPASSVSLVDTLADASIEDNEVLYTSGNVLPAIEPPPSIDITPWQNRLFSLSKDAIYYTREILANEAPAYHEALTIPVPAGGGDPVAVRAFADRLLLFKEHAIYAIEGQPLDDTGSGGGYAWPFLLSNSVGARNPRTIVEVQDGLLFESQDQIWKVDRGFQLTPAGESVRLWKGSDALTGAHLIPSKHVAVFTRADERALVYDWLRDRWALWTAHDSSSSCVADGVLYRVDSSGQVERDNASGARLAAAVETGWVSLAGIMGFQRVWEIAVLGQFHATVAGPLTVKIAYNGDPYWVDDIDFDASLLTAFDYSDYLGAGMTSAMKDQTPIMKFKPSRQKCTSIRIRIETTAGDDISLNAVSLLLGMRGGTHRVGAGRIA